MPVSQVKSSGPPIPIVASPRPAPWSPSADSCHRFVQIGQLLASITGEKPAIPAAIPPSRTAYGLPSKRKADEDGKGSAQKVSRTASTPAANGTAKPTGDASNKPPRPADRQSSGYTGSARPSSSTTTPRSLAEKSVSSASKKPALGTNGRPSPTYGSFSSNIRSTPPSTSSLAKRPATATAAQAPDSTGKAPKKGSIAEIKARAAAQQNKLLAIGKIQHKATEKQPTKKEREEAAAEELRAVKKGLKPGMKPGVGLPSRNGPNGMQRNGIAHLDRARGAVQKPGMPSGKPGKAPPAVEEKKPKKSALATTGYAGSARPPPSKAKPGLSRPGASGAGHDRERDKRPNPMGMFSKPRHRRDEEYDEDMEDFVVDDEEEEDDGYGYGARYKYADEDDDSDMEAGYSDVEDEEAEAAKMARLEDAREQAILERRRREKEARKRGLPQGRR